MALLTSSRLLAPPRGSWLPLAAACTGSGLRAQTAAADAAWPDLAALARIEVTTATRRASALQDTPAAVTVVTGQEILLSGADSIPEALHLVPGLSVAQIHGSAWGIGARGFPYQFATKLLVMIDGRAVYTPVFGGVFWDVQDTFLEDIDRIEVVLGATGSLWGANAVNGVVNILTKDAGATLGDLAYTTLDDDGHRSGGVRHGWQVAPRTAARIYAKYRSTRETRLVAGGTPNDETEFAQNGFRLDGATANARSTWTLQGDAYRGWNSLDVWIPTLAAPPLYKILDTDGETTSGYNLLGRWETTLDSGSRLRWQAYFDEAARDGAMFSVRVRNADLEFQHSLAPTARHTLDWGLKARRTTFTSKERWISFVDAPTTDLVSGFIQDQYALIPDKLALLGGVKLEYSSNSSFEPQPSLKLVWPPSPRHTLWVAAARAVRTPAYTELANRTDTVLPPGAFDPSLPTALRGLGTLDLKAEHLNTLDLGWRWQPLDTLTLTSTAYLDGYTSLIKVTGDPLYVQTEPYPGLIYPLPEDNGMAGQVIGGEFAARWQAHPRCRVDLGYAYIHVCMWSTTSDPFNFVRSGRLSSPQHAAHLALTLAPAARWELATTLRFVDRRHRFDIPSYLECDLNLCWKPTDNWEVGLVGRNLLHAYHSELYPSLAGPRVEIPRTFLLKLTWHH